MRRPRASELVLGVVAVIAVSAHMVLHVRMSRAIERIQRTEAAIPKPTPKTMQTTYIDTSGITRTINTTRNAGETIQAWADRHAQDIIAMMELHPPQD